MEHEPQVSQNRAKEVLVKKVLVEFLLNELIFILYSIETFFCGKELFGS